MRAQYGLVGRLDALRTYHAPERMEDLAAARKRLVFEELFMVQLALLLRRQRLLAAQRLRFLQYLARLGAGAAGGSAGSQGGVAVAAKFKVR